VTGKDGVEVGEEELLGCCLAGDPAGQGRGEVAAFFRSSGKEHSRISRSAFRPRVTIFRSIPCPGVDHRAAFPVYPEANASL